MLVPGAVVMIDAEAMGADAVDGGVVLPVAAPGGVPTTGMGVESIYGPQFFVFGVGVNPCVPTVSLRCGFGVAAGVRAAGAAARGAGDVGVPDVRRVRRVRGDRLHNQRAAHRMERRAGAGREVSTTCIRLK